MQAWPSTRYSLPTRQGSAVPTGQILPATPKFLRCTKNFPFLGAQSVLRSFLIRVWHQHVPAGRNCPPGQLRCKMLTVNPTGMCRRRTRPLWGHDCPQIIYLNRIENITHEYFSFNNKEHITPIVRGQGPRAVPNWSAHHEQLLEIYIFLNFTLRWVVTRVRISATTASGTPVCQEQGN